LKLVGELPRPCESFTIVLTGDGRWEERVLRGLSERVDGRYVLWWPRPPLPGEWGRPTGLRALMRAVKGVLLFLAGTPGG